jgi:hypothetical protein
MGRGDRHRRLEVADRQIGRATIGATAVRTPRKSQPVPADPPVTAAPRTSRPPWWISTSPVAITVNEVAGAEIGPGPASAGAVAGCSRGSSGPVNSAVDTTATTAVPATRPGGCLQRIVPHDRGGRYDVAVFGTTPVGRVPNPVVGDAFRRGHPLAAAADRRRGELWPNRGPTVLIGSVQPAFMVRFSGSSHRTWDSGPGADTPRPGR